MSINFTKFLDMYKTFLYFIGVVFNDKIDLFLFIYLRHKKVHIYTHTKKKRNIKPETCKIEKDKFKTKLAQNIDNNKIHNTSQMTSMM